MIGLHLRSKSQRVKGLTKILNVVFRIVTGIRVGPGAFEILTKTKVPLSYHGKAELIKNILKLLFRARDRFR